MNSLGFQPQARDGRRVWVTAAATHLGLKPQAAQRALGAAAGVPPYVWHCHILEHEDNDMMRPYNLLP